MFTLPAYDNIICNCGKFIRNEGNTGRTFNECIDCSNQVSECTNCELVYTRVMLCNGLCTDCISETESESESISSSEIEDISDEEGPVCDGCYCLDDNLVERLCEDCLEIITIGEE